MKNVENPIFNKKYNFSIEDKQSLSYKLYSANTINPEFEIKDDNAQNIGIFKPKIIIVTSYYDINFTHSF